MWPRKWRINEGLLNRYVHEKSSPENEGIQPCLRKSAYGNICIRQPISAYICGCDHLKTIPDAV